MARVPAGGTAEARIAQRRVGSRSPWDSLEPGGVGRRQRQCRSRGRMACAHMEPPGFIHLSLALITCRRWRRRIAGEDQPPALIVSPL